jgi:AraC-like DNA-binding protein/quercetin dioxygenase-like cupin family protein
MGRSAWDNAVMLVTGVPGALVWPAALLVWGPGYSSSEHRHHCVQLVMALRGRLRVRAGRGRRWNLCEAVLVKPDTPHEVEAHGASILIAFVEPESELGAALLTRLARGVTPVEPSRVDRWRASLGDPATLVAARVETWVRTELLLGRQPPSLHPRVKRVLRFLRAELANIEAHSLDRLAAVAGLSPSRFMHVFTDSVGVAVRPYVLWLRLQRALGELMAGATVTQAAHAAGFSDAAHLSRTVRRMLGTTPQELVRRKPATGGAQVQSV